MEPAANKSSDQNSSFPTKYACEKTKLHKRTIKSLTTLHLSSYDPLFIYSLSITTKYHIVLDQTVLMGDKMWTLGVHCIGS